MPLIRDYVNGRWIDREINIMPTMLPTEIEAKFVTLADEYSIETYPQDYREHLGMSIIGDECWRKLWYGWRWVKVGNPEGRMRRLWQRGHDEEKKFEEFLLWAGIKIRTIDPKTDKQFKVSVLEGHYGGSTDGIGLVSWLDDLPIILEFKTHNDKSFTDLKTKKVKLSKPTHYAQMCSYGQGFEIKYALYCAVNKNTDEWYFEFVELDWNYALELQKKAYEIIISPKPVNRISEQPSYWKCKFCEFKGICHDNEPIEKNCRSCQFASPDINSTWKCGKFGGTIPKDFIKVGCGEWKGVV